MKNFGTLKLLPLGLLALVVFLSGCATVLHNPNEMVHVRSSAPQSRVKYKTQVCQAPCTLSVARGDTGMISSHAIGFEPQERNLDRTVNPITFVNVLFWPGFFVDLMSGSFWKTLHRDIYFEMPASAGSSPIVSQNSILEFEKTIPKKKKPLVKTKEDLNDKFPSGWPNKWYYETPEYRYWTIVSDRKAHPNSALKDSLKKAEELIAVEFPKERYPSAISFESTHAEVKKSSGLYRGWRIVRVAKKEF